MSLKSELIYYSKLCSQNKFVTATDGNLSVRTRKNYILITAANTYKNKLKPSDLIKADFNEKKVLGKSKISSEFKLHKYIYEQRKDVKAIVHTHPKFSSAFAVAGLSLDKIVLPEIYIKLGKIPLARYGTPSTDELPLSIQSLVKDYNAILLANHGLVTFGKTLEEAYHLTEKVEQYAEICFYARMLGGEKEISKAHIKKLDNLVY
jgi:L-fuculose-phosphate aldolase